MSWGGVPGGGRGGRKQGEASGTVVAEPSCHHSRTSTFNRVLCTLPSYSRHCTALRWNPSKPLFRPLPPPLVGRVLSAGVFSFFKGQRWVQGSAVFPGVQINLRLGSNISSTGLFDESVGQWHALAVMPWSLAFSPCHFPPHLSARLMPASSTWVAHRPNLVFLGGVITSETENILQIKCLEILCIKYPS